MPKHNCPFPGCTFVTNDCNDDLAAVVLKIHAEGVHLSQSSRHKPVKVENVSRPIISTGGTSEDWSYFIIRWNDYKAATKIEGTDLIIQLLECCNEDLRKDLTRAAGGSLTSKSENEVLEKIKTLAVRRENIMVARVELQEMQQDEGEPIRSFAARAKGQANVCKFVVDCPSCSTTVDYTNQALRDVLVRGVLDNDIQLDLLSQNNEDMSVEDTIIFVEAKESGKRSASKLSHSSQTAAVKSQYQKSKSFAAGSGQKCNYCGKSGHGRNAPLKLRKTKCPAYGKVCTHCGIPNHTSELCRTRLNISNKEKSSPVCDAPVLVSECPVWEALCSVECNTSGQNLAIDHHIYSNMEGRWIKRRSKPQPSLKMIASIHKSDYHSLGVNLPVKEVQLNVVVIPDTGCQSTIASMAFARQLGIHKEDLLQSGLKMVAVNKTLLNILGKMM